MRIQLCFYLCRDIYQFVCSWFRGFSRAPVEIDYLLPKLIVCRRISHVLKFKFGGILKMTAREQCKTKLSKGILEMKFMKKTKEKVEKQMFQEEGEEYFGAQLTNRMKQGSGKFIIEPSFVFCEGLIDGRVSFRGMNPEIERLMELEQEAKLAATEKPRETDVSDEQMAKVYKSIAVNSIEKKFTPKKEFKRLTRNDSEEEPSGKKPKFLKPVD